MYIRFLTSGHMESEAFSPSGSVEMDDLDFIDQKAKRQFKDLDIYEDL